MTPEEIRVWHTELIEQIIWSARILSIVLAFGVIAVTFALFDISTQLRRRR